MRKRYPSDLTDEQWRRIEHLFEAGRRGRPRQVPARNIVNAVLYVMKNGCAWRALPHDFPRWQTVFVQRQCWTSAGLLIAAFKHLAAGRQPSVGLIDATFIESAYGGRGTAPNGYKRAARRSGAPGAGRRTRVRVLRELVERYATAPRLARLKRQVAADPGLLQPNRRHSSPGLGVMLSNPYFRTVLAPLRASMTART